ncbi:DUF4097 family beta strand repeat-containing protein [Thermomonas brevis]
MRLLPALFALSLAVAAPAWAATPINEIRPLSPTGRVDIDNLKGRIQVRAWDRDEVKIEGSLGKGVERLLVEGGRERLEVRVRYPRNSRGTEDTTLLLTVPRRAELDIESVAADIDVEGVAQGKLSIESVSGDVVVVAAPRALDAETVSGDLRVTVNTGDAKLESVSGDVTLRGRLPGKVAAETVSGDIDIEVNGERVRSLKAATVSGDARVRTVLADGGEIRLESVSGNLRLATPAGLSARVSAETFSGDLRAPDARIQRPKYGPGASLETRYGAGQGTIRMETFSGDGVLEIR